MLNRIKESLNSFDRKLAAETGQTQAELHLANKVLIKYRDAKNAKAPYVSKWKECMNGYDGKTNNKYPDYKADHCSNFIFSVIETIIPIMTDGDPKFMAIPNTSAQVKIADLVQVAFEYEWRRTKMQAKLSDAIRLSLIIGTSIWGVFWDKNASGGIGEAKPVLINPFNFFPDPMATDMFDAQYVIYASYKSIEELKKRYPSKASLLAGGSINDEDLTIGTKDVSSVKNHALILECWTRDYDEFEDVEEIHQGIKTKVKKLKYPNGRIIVTTEDGVLLEDKANPYDDGNFPFILTKNYQKPFEFWGVSEIEQLLRPQHYINDLNNQIIDNARLTGNMPWIIDKNAGIGQGKLTNRPGLVIRKNPGTEVMRMSPPTMPRYIQDKIDELKKDMEIISGIHDITQGRKPGGITAAAAIEALQEAGQARIRLKVRLLESSLAELGDLWFSRMKQFWITNREVQRLNPDFSVKFETINNDMLKGDVSIFVVAGSTMPINRASRLQQMIQLAQTPAEDGMPVLDRQAILEVTDITDRDKILERFAALKQMQTQAVPAPPPETEEETSTPPIDSQPIPQQAPMQTPMMGAQAGASQDALAQIVQILGTLPDEVVQQILKEAPEIADLLQGL